MSQTGIDSYPLLHGNQKLALLNNPHEYTHIRGQGLAHGQLLVTGHQHWPEPTTGPAMGLQAQTKLSLHEAKVNLHAYHFISDRPFLIYRPTI